MLCSCDCESNVHSNYEINSPKCSEHGTYKCGICDCNEDYFGRECQCSIKNNQKEEELTGGCRKGNSTIECSRQGTCQCGVCVCDKRQDPAERISGQYCECDNYSCDRNNGLLCSGPDHGTCSCGTCICEKGWTGTDCHCRSSQDACMPQNGTLCSGHGTCDCGECKCDLTPEGRYSGQFCERCPTCPGRCAEFAECVQCQVHKTGPLAKDDLCATNCTLFTPTEVEKIEIDEAKDEHMCTFYDEEDCRYFFAYSDKGDKVTVRAQKERDCPAKVFMLGIVLAVIAAIVLMGLAILLLWKLLTTIHDRREFARFEKERHMAKWDTGENPIYKQATSTFKNPTYAGK